MDGPVGALIIFLAGLFFLGLFVAGWCGCLYGCADCIVVCCDVLYVHYVLALLLYHRAELRLRMGPRY